MTSAADVAAQREGRGSVGAALARLWVYVKRNRRAYLLGTVVTLGYTATFVAVPLLVRWAKARAVRHEADTDRGREDRLLRIAGTRGALIGT